MRPGNSLTWVLRGVGVLAALCSAAGCGSKDDNRPGTWGYIYPAIIEPSCATASCHSDFTQRSGVNLGDIDTAYGDLTSRHFVQPMDVANSELIYLLRAKGARRMPPDFALPETDIQTIEYWISNSGKND